MWSLPELKLNQIFQRQGKKITEVAFTIRGDHLLASSMDGMLRVWDWGKKRMLHQLHFDGPIAGFALRSIDSNIVVSTQQGDITILYYEKKLKIVW